MQTEQELKDILRAALDGKAVEVLRNVNWHPLAMQKALEHAAWVLGLDPLRRGSANLLRIKPEPRTVVLWGTSGGFSPNRHYGDTHCLTLVESDGEWTVQSFERVK